MIDILEMAYAEDPDGWVHLYRLSACIRLNIEIPEDTQEYLSAFANGMLEAKHNVRFSNRKDFNASISEAALHGLKILKSSKGGSSFKDKSRNDLAQTKAWGHAKAVSRKLKNEPLLSQSEAIAIVATHLDKDENTIRRAWNELGETVHGMFEFYALDLRRLEAVKKDHAKRLIQCLSNRSLKNMVLSVKIPNVTKPIRVNLTFTDTAFSEQDGLPEILSCIARWNDEQHSPSTWESLSNTVLCIISAKILSHIER